MNKLIIFLLLLTALCLISVRFLTIPIEKDTKRKLLEVEWEVSWEESTESLTTKSVAITKDKIIKDIIENKLDESQSTITDVKMLNKEDFIELESYINKNNLWILNKTFKDENITDPSTVKITLKSISNNRLLNYGENMAITEIKCISINSCPKQVKELVDSIEKLSIDYF